MSDARKITRRAGVVALATLASRVMGMARDMVVASLFPAAVTDVFFVAFTIPNALRQIVGEGALTPAVVPVMTETLANQGRDAARRLVAALTGAALVGLSTLALLGTVAAPALVWLYGSGLSRFPGRLDLAGDLTAVMFGYVWFAGMLALAMGVLNSVGRFFAPAFAPVLLNVALVACGLLLSEPLRRAGLEPVTSLAIGVMVGGALQFALQIPALRREGMLPWPRLDWSHPGVQQVLRLMAPALVGLSVYQANIIISRTFASFLPEGSVTYLYYTFRLVELPQGLFVYALASAMLPSLSGFAARGDTEGLKDAYRFALRQALFVALPAAVGLAALALPIVTVVFQRGRFDGTAAAATAWSLHYQAPGIVALAGVRQTVQVFFALKDTRTPVKASALNLTLYLGLCVALMGPMLHAGLSLAITLAALAQLAYLIVALRRRLGGLGLRSLAAPAAKAAVAAAGCGAAAAGVARFGAWERGGNDPANVAILVAAIAAGGAAYAALSFALRSAEARELADALRRRRARRAGGEE